MPFRLLFAAALLICAPASFAAAEGGRYLPDILAGGPQAEAMKTMLAGAPAHVAWVKELKGPSGPSRIVEVAGQRREIGFICKQNACMNNQFKVLFSADGAFAVGLLITASGPEFFGSPTPAERKALVETQQP
ncbi:Ivy family c-type lysozyme inhibitor [Methylopila turkensis]|uniref:Inhibitor of vertebrate lysozyme n=1 Tax=Methylopila turkensis TaxID=1437816 RepID=A0A9W6JP01_9HYPH|nr:Ivy family c-type lysozyme inhibitor [Methylopila turkensis]GLK80617.1 hypothetical protein GCM10008174_23580 [Methylopila turkensis]